MDFKKGDRVRLVEIHEEDAYYKNRKWGAGPDQFEIKEGDEFTLLVVRPHTHEKGYFYAYMRRVLSDTTHGFLAVKIEKV